MLTVRPATVTGPVLASPLLMPDVIVAVPEPGPLPKTESQFAPLAELQVHPCAVLIETVAEPPVAGKLSEPGLTS